MVEILEMSKEIKFNNLIYQFKGSSPSIIFTEFEGPMYTYAQLKTLQQVKKEQKNFRSELGQTTSGDQKKIKKQVKYNKKC